jgi:hypothetical protein
MEKLKLKGIPHPNPYPSFMVTKRTTSDCDKTMLVKFSDWKFQ